MSTDQNESWATIESYHQAWTGGDVEGAMSHLAEDFRCSAPDDGIRNRDDWRAYLDAFVPMLTGAPELARMSDGDRLALWYFPQTAGTTTALASELFTVRGGLITEIHVVFDRLSYVPADQKPG